MLIGSLFSSSSHRNHLKTQSHAVISNITYYNWAMHNFNNKNFFLFLEKLHHNTFYIDEWNLFSLDHVIALFLR